MRSRPHKRHKKISYDVRDMGRVSAWSSTDVGLRRDNNEDNHLVDSNLQLYVVADGMGGHAGGATASRMAIELVRETISNIYKDHTIFNRHASQHESSEILQLLKNAIRAASWGIYELSSQRPDLAGMGTTLTMFLVYGKQGYVAHVGDSRLYRMRNRTFEQLTEDHSLVQEQVRAGFLTREEAHNSRFRNIITRSVGFESQVNADSFSFSLSEGDVFLLCSDGLSGMVDDKEIAKELRQEKLSDAASRLTALANQHGGEDNITLILLRYHL
jgi:serine/threonine protein phosphatase PrpC